MTDLLAHVGTALSQRYRIEHELGRGGSATVYLPTDLRHGRLFALKVLRPEIAVSLGAERFLREIHHGTR
jgi:eukaryotic-like serine/threonine-protein kinase